MGKPKAQTIQQRFGFSDPQLSTPKHDEMMLWLDEHLEDLIPSIVKLSSGWNEEEVTSWVATAQDAIDCERARLERDRQWKSDEFMRLWEKGIDSWTVWDKEQAALHKSVIEKVKDGLERIEGRTASDLLGPLPPFHAFKIKEKTWEYPITTQQKRGYGNKYIVGFADMRAVVGLPSLGVAGIRREAYSGIVGIDDGGLKWTVGWGQTVSETKNILFEIKPQIQSLGELVRQIRMYQEYEDGLYVIVCPDDRFSEPLKRQGICFCKYLGGAS